MNPDVKKVLGKFELESHKVELALTDDFKNSVKSAESIYSKVEKSITDIDSLEQQIINKRKELKQLQQLGEKEYNSLLNIWDKINTNSKELGLDPYKSITGFQDAKKLMNFLKTNIDVVDEYMKPI